MMEKVNKMTFVVFIWMKQVGSCVLVQEKACSCGQSFLRSSLGFPYFFRSNLTGLILLFVVPFVMLGFAFQLYGIVFSYEEHRIWALTIRFSLYVNQNTKT